MKYFIALFILSLSSICLNGQIVDIPDPEFKQELIDAGVDTNDDQEIQVSEAESLDSLTLQNTAIFDLKGLEAFVNLIFLDLSINQFTTIDLTSNTKIRSLDCSSNYVLDTLKISSCLDLEKLYLSFTGPLSDLNLSNNINLKELDLEVSEISNLDLSTNINLEILNFYGVNNLNVLDLSNNNKLSHFVCENNLLIESVTIHSSVIEEIICRDNPVLTYLDASDCPSLKSIDCRLNTLETLNLDGNISLEVINCPLNVISELDLSTCKNLRKLDCELNNLNSLDLGSNYLLDSLNCRLNILEFLNIKNGSLESQLEFDELSIDYLCADFFQINEIKAMIDPFSFVEINSYCAFQLDGAPHISGRILYDEDSDGCDFGQTQVIPNGKLNVLSGSLESLISTNSDGNYYIYPPAGTYSISPKIENEQYFKSDPESFTFNLPDDGDSLVQDFCIVPRFFTQDLDIYIIPLDGARPGFQSRYKIIYENNGTKTVTGQVHFFYEPEFTEFISADPAQDKENASSLTWEYEDLKPFESREIIVTMEHNSPMDTPALNGGDILIFKASIDPKDNFVKTLDNNFCLQQDVVNSFDPNDKTCLQGNTITEEYIGQYVHYMIRFENTGSAEAVNIVVKDSIDATKFNIDSLEITQSSHDLYMQINDGNVVEFIFEDIYLPFDDATNDGYVVFKIKTLPTLQIGDSFDNTAEIYFDFNFPIITNTETTTIEILSSNENLVKDDIQVNIFPNPARDKIEIQSEFPFDNVLMRNIEGKLMKQVSVTNFSKSLSLDISDINPGVYLLHIETENGLLVKELVIK